MKTSKKVFKVLGIGCAGISAISILIFVIITLFFYKGCGAKYDSYEDVMLANHMLKKGIVKYEVPDTIKVGESKRITVQIKHRTSDLISERSLDTLEAWGDSDLALKIEENYYRPSVSVDSVQISNYVEVHVFDPKQKFNIDSLFVNRFKLIDSLSYATWEWEVSPLEAGRHPIMIKISTRIFDGFERNYKELKVFEKEIFIQSDKKKTIIDFWNNHWQWLISVLILPLFLWLRKEFFTWKKKNKPKAGFRRD